MRETALSKDLGLVCKSCFFSLLLILVYFCLLYSILWLSLEEACPVRDLRRVSVHTTFKEQSCDMQWDWITLCREATFLPLIHSWGFILPDPPGMCSTHKWPFMKRASPVIPPSNPSRFCVPTWAGKWVAAALLKTHSHYTLGAESWGNFDSAVSGRAAGRHVPAWVSVGLCIPPSSSSSSFLGHPGMRHGRYQVLRCARWHRWWISRAYMERDSLFFFPNFEVYFSCPKATGSWFAALSQSMFAKGSRKACRTAICTSFSQNPSYHFNYSKLWFFLYINII